MLLQGLLYAVTTVPPSSHTCAGGYRRGCGGGACCADVQVLAPESAAIDMLVADLVQAGTQSTRQAPVITDRE